MDSPLPHTVFHFQGQLWEDSTAIPLTYTIQSLLKTVGEAWCPPSTSFCQTVFFQSAEAFCFIILYAISSALESHKIVQTCKLKHLNKIHQLYTHIPQHIKEGLLVKWSFYCLTVHFKQKQNFNTIYLKYFISSFKSICFSCWTVFQNLFDKYTLKLLSILQAFYHSLSTNNTNTKRYIRFSKNLNTVKTKKQNSLMNKVICCTVTVFNVYDTLVTSYSI